MRYVVGFLFVMLCGCARTPEQQAISLAQDDLDCGEVQLRWSRSHFGTVEVLVEGCGRYAYYRCDPDFEGDYWCSRVDTGRVHW